MRANKIAHFNTTLFCVNRRFPETAIDLEKLPLAGSEDNGLNNEQMFCETCHIQSKQREATKYCKRCDAAFCKEHNKVCYNVSQ